ncbi:MAG: dTMP kinase [Spirochaetales bacterium]|nr:dTMP kinase [Spirochaetales bacterium]
MQTEVLNNFIVLEGLDGSGTTTQLKKIEEKLSEMGKTVFSTCEPTKNEIGKLIRSVLQKKIVMDPVTVSRLFVADRNEHIYGINGIKERTKRGEIVVSDRYLFSSLAYQSPQCGFDFVKIINSDFPLPEYLFFISTPVKECQERIHKRGDEKELFDDADYQQKVDDNYRKAIELYKNSGVKIFIIDGLKSIENITNEIIDIIR